MPAKTNIERVRAVWLVIGVMLGTCAWLPIGIHLGRVDMQSDLPSCLYLRRGYDSARPWGYDGKEGVDWFCTDIQGGGIYVSLAKWKRGYHSEPYENPELKSRTD
jgi:hypothetical protein